MRIARSGGGHGLLMDFIPVDSCISIGICGSYLALCSSGVHNNPLRQEFDTQTWRKLNARSLRSRKLLLRHDLGSGVPSSWALIIADDAPAQQPSLPCNTVLRLPMPTIIVPPRYLVFSGCVPTLVGGYGYPLCCEHCSINNPLHPGIHLLDPDQYLIH